MDPLLPDAARTAFTAGLGFNLTPKIALDLAFQHEIFSDRTSPNRSIPAYQLGAINIGESIYDITANLFAVSLSFGF
jgi:long-subunit fatty acid transport protein